MRLTKLHRKFAIVFLAIVFSCIFGMIGTMAAPSSDQGGLPSLDSPFLTIPNQPPQGVTAGPRTANNNPSISNTMILKANDRTIVGFAYATDPNPGQTVQVLFGWYYWTGSTWAQITAVFATPQGNGWFCSFLNRPAYSTGQTLLLLAIAMDGYGGSAYQYSSQFGVTNDVPYIEVTPIVYVNDHTVGVAIQAYDTDAPDYATLIVSCAWFINGVGKFAEYKPAIKDEDLTSTFLFSDPYKASGAAFATGEVIEVLMTVTDGYATSGPVLRSHTVTNIIPVILSIAPILVSGDSSSLTIGAGIADIDAPSHGHPENAPTLVTIFEWYVQPQGGSSGLAKQNVHGPNRSGDWVTDTLYLSEGLYAMGDAVYVRVFVTDGAMVSVAESGKTIVTAPIYYPADPTSGKFYSQAKPRYENEDFYDSLVHSVQIKVGGANMGFDETGHFDAIDSIIITTETSVNPDRDGYIEGFYPVHSETESWIAIEDTTIKIRIKEDDVPMTGARVAYSFIGGYATHGNDATKTDAEVSEIISSTYELIYGFVDYVGDAWSVISYVQKWADLLTEEKIEDPGTVSNDYALWGYHKPYINGYGSNSALTDQGLKVAVIPDWNLSGGQEHNIMIQVETTVKLVRLDNCYASTWSCSYYPHCTLTYTNYFCLMMRA